MALPLFQDIRRLISLEPSKRELTPEELAVYQQVLTRFVTYYTSMNQQDTTLDKDLSAINSITEFTGLPPWSWSKDDYERWCVAMLRNKKSVDTIRSYQGSVLKFMNFLFSEKGLCKAIHIEFKVVVKEVGKSWGVLRNFRGRNPVKSKRFLDEDQILLLFECLDREIIKLHESGKHERSLKLLQRDRIMFSTHYYYLLRAHECRGLTLESFFQNDDHKEFGKYGGVFVYGKGHNGSGKEFDTLYTLHRAQAANLKWYIDNIRPYFVRNLSPKDQEKQRHVFLNTGGRKITSSSYTESFNRMTSFCDDKFVVDQATSHFLRHTGTSDLRLRGMTLEGVKAATRHKLAGTVEVYSGGLKESSKRQYNAIMEELVDIDD